MKRPFVLVAVWIVAAAAAVGVGFLAVSLIDASAATPAQPGIPAASTGTEAATTSPAASTSGEQGTPGGTVYATCSGGTAQLAGAPAAGWTVESSPGQVEFRSGRAKIEVRADCSTGSPQFTVESGDDGTTSPAPATSSTVDSTPSSPAVDDHGRRRGGHGSDD
jgi:hypothetical protein